MKIKENIPPRTFEVGGGKKIELKDCGKIFLESNEQVTFLTDNGAEYDVAKKDWGFYATPSLNGRLKGFGLRAALVKSPVNKYYLLLLEKGKESEFQEYIDVEKHSVLCWLDEDKNLSNLEKKINTSALNSGCVCGNESNFYIIHTYDSPPKGEVLFGFSSQENYWREIIKCKNCNHFLSIHKMNTEKLYKGDYVSSNYQDKEGILNTFNKMNTLEQSKSDNIPRVKNIVTYAKDYFGEKFTPSILDVGSGLCVFLYQIKKNGWNCTALDPDIRSVKHAKENVGVNAVCMDFLESKNLGTFDIITFNKVLEHVKDPIKMLAKAHDFLNKQGFVYLEVPDGEVAARDGFHREEFFIDHYHIFSSNSINFLANKAGFQVDILERLQEPSTKYTLRAFLRVKK